MINKCLKFFGSCGHKPCFHRFTRSTDDAKKVEKKFELQIESELPQKSEDNFCKWITPVPLRTLDTNSFTKNLASLNFKVKNPFGLLKGDANYITKFCSVFKIAISFAFYDYYY